MMAQENHSPQVTMKSFLDRGDGAQPEVRRFSVDVAVSTSFGYLEEKLRTVYPILKSRDFRVTWKDVEGDDVVISSDAELMEALVEHSSSNVRTTSSSSNEIQQQQLPFKVHVKLVGGPAQQQTGQHGSGIGAGGATSAGEGPTAGPSNGEGLRFGPADLIFGLGLGQPGGAFSPGGPLAGLFGGRPPCGPHGSGPGPCKRPPPPPFHHWASAFRRGSKSKSRSRSRSGRKRSGSGKHPHPHGHSGGQHRRHHRPCQHGAGPSGAEGSGARTGEGGPAGYGYPVLGQQLLSSLKFLMEALSGVLPPPPQQPEPQPESGTSSSSSDEEAGAAGPSTDNAAGLSDTWLEDLCSLLQAQLGINCPSSDDIRRALRGEMNPEIFNFLGSFGIPAAFQGCPATAAAAPGEAGCCPKEAKKCAKRAAKEEHKAKKEEKRSMRRESSGRRRHSRGHRSGDAPTAGAAASGDAVVDVDVDGDNPEVMAVDEVEEQRNPPSAAVPEPLDGQFPVFASAIGQQGSSPQGQVTSEWTMLDDESSASDGGAVAATASAPLATEKDKQLADETGARPKILFGRGAPAAVPAGPAIDQGQGQPSTSTQPGQQLYPDVSADTAQSMEQSVTSHPDPLVNRSLQIMLNMGFTNDGGWLSSLLEAKRGDIAEVLDVLRPHRKLM